MTEKACAPKRIAKNVIINNTFLEKGKEKKHSPRRIAFFEEICQRIEIYLSTFCPDDEIFDIYLEFDDKEESHNAICLAKLMIIMIHKDSLCSMHFELKIKCRALRQEVYFSSDLEDHQKPDNCDIRSYLRDQAVLQTKETELEKVKLHNILCVHIRHVLTTHTQESCIKIKKQHAS